MFFISLNANALIKIPVGKCALVGKLMYLNDFEDIKTKSIYLSINSGTNSETRIKLLGDNTGPLADELERAGEVKIKLSIKNSKVIYSFYGAAMFLGEYRLIEPFEELPLYLSSESISKTCVGPEGQLPRYAKHKNIFYKRVPANKPK